MTVTKHDMLQYNVRMHPSRTSTQHARRHCGPESVCALYKMPSDLHAFWTFDLQRLFLICAHHVLGSGHYAILRARTVSPTSWKNHPRFACKMQIQMSRVLHSYIPFVVFGEEAHDDTLKSWLSTRSASNPPSETRIPSDWRAERPREYWRQSMFMRSGYLLLWGHGQVISQPLVASLQLIRVELSFMQQRAKEEESVACCNGLQVCKITSFGKKIWGSFKRVDALVKKLSR